MLGCKKRQKSKDQPTEKQPITLSKPVDVNKENEVLAEGKGAGRAETYRNDMGMVKDTEGQKQ